MDNQDVEIPEKILLFIFEQNKNGTPVKSQTLYENLDLSEYENARWSSPEDKIRLSLEKLLKINMVIEGNKGELNIEPSYLTYVRSLFESENNITIKRNE